MFLIVADDPGEALEELAPYYHHVFATYGAWMNEDNAIGMASPATQPMDLDAFKSSGIHAQLFADKVIPAFT